MIRNTYFGLLEHSKIKRKEENYVCMSLLANALLGTMAAVTMAIAITYGGKGYYPLN